MSSAMAHIKRLLRSGDAVTVDEYAILLVLIVLVAVAAIQLVGEKVSSFFGTVAQAIADAM